jgi:hypothetical protein
MDPRFRGNDEYFGADVAFAGTTNSLVRMSPFAGTTNSFGADIAYFGYG